MSQREALRALVALEEVDAGSVLLDGRPADATTPRAALARGMLFLSSDRAGEAIFGELGVRKNIVLTRLRDFVSGLFVAGRREAEAAGGMIESFAIKTPELDTPIIGLSGGNQQKAVVAREFSRPRTLLIAAQPTRGVDVGSTEFIHRKIVEARDGGSAVLLVSAELDEVMSLSDRIGVISKGRIVATYSAGEATKEQLGLAMAGGRGVTEHVDSVAPGSRS